MNSEQIMGLIRQILPVLGGIAMTFGWLTPGQVATGTATILSIAGPGLIVISTIWSLVAKTNTALVTAAVAVPGVSHIVLQANPDGIELSKATPPNVRVGP